MNRSSFVRGVGIAALCFVGTLFSDEGGDSCSRENLLSNFSKPFVLHTLEKFEVPKEKWDNIVKGLQEHDHDVIVRVEEKASKVDPNMLRDPKQREQAVKLFRESLSDVFQEVMKANGVDNQEKIQAMLDDIQKQKARLFADCMEKRRAEQQVKEKPAPAKESLPAAAPASEPALPANK